MYGHLRTCAGGDFLARKNYEMQERVRAEIGMQTMMKIMSAKCSTLINTGMKNTLFSSGSLYQTHISLYLETVKAEKAVNSPVVTSWLTSNRIHYYVIL